MSPSAGDSPFEPNPRPYFVPVVRSTPARRSRRRLLFLLASIAAVVAVSLAIAFVTLVVRFGLIVPGSCPSTGASENFPPESSVTFHWSTTNGLRLNVSVTDLGGVAVYLGAGSTGVGFFSTVAGPYTFNATPCGLSEVRVAGTYVYGGALL